MANVRGSEGGPGDRNEYVEVYNNSPDTIDLVTYRIHDCEEKAIPDEITAWDDDSLLVKYPGVRIHSTIMHPFTYAVILDREYTVPDSIYPQPYAFPESVLILTTDDTSIGDGLTNNDPVIVFSAAETCTTAFGTPHDTLDGFPYDAGDGVAWERIDLEQEDTPLNWYPSISAAGGTPGCANSVANACDLALDAALVDFIPSTLRVGEDLRIEIGVINAGIKPTVEYTVEVYDDCDRDSLCDVGELVDVAPGQSLGAFDTATVYADYADPTQGVHVLGFRVVYAEDRDTCNNLVFKALQVLGTVSALQVSPEIFTPNADGIGDRLQIDYRVPEANGELTITVFDGRGKRVHDVCRRQTVLADHGTLYWDGSAGDKRAMTGLYVVYLEYRCHDRTMKCKKTAVLVR